MSHLTVVGAGYVGLTTAVCLAYLGHDVRCTDVDASKVRALADGKVPIVEEGLGSLLREGLDSGRLTFGRDNVAAVRDAEFVFLCVPTPQSESGRADMTYINGAASEIGPHLVPGAIVVNKSTVPVGSTKVVEAALGRSDVAVVSNPEFLREGSAVHDFLHPDRIVIGADDEASAVKVARLFLRTRAPVVLTDPPSAETIKYASNAYLATKISFVNAIAALCEAAGADVRAVTAGMGLDPRIGAEFLRPGPGWGGSCFPKDTHALVRIAEDVGYDFKLLKGAIEANDEQYALVVSKVRRFAGGSLAEKTVALWGLTFKAGTDDVRSSPAVDIAHRIVAEGATVRAFDPTVSSSLNGIDVYPTALEACAGADVLLVATEWNQFRSEDFEAVGRAMSQRCVVDGRNLLERDMVVRAGFTYEGIGIA
ncbi:MAG: UDP-glucose dehydrogenase family protein [Deltaproteobacteria bacterium]